MTAAIVVATIALVGSLLSGALALYGQMRSSAAQVRRDAEATLSRYREPLVAAAYELQSRLFNILRQGFLDKYYVRGKPDERDYAVKNTLYLLGQYLGWTEILRWQIQFLDFGEVEETREIARRQGKIRDVLASDEPKLGTPFMIWRGEQRAIGERMIVTQSESPAFMLRHRAAASVVVRHLQDLLSRVLADLLGMVRRDVRLHVLDELVVGLA